MMKVMRMGVRMARVARSRAVFGMEMRVRMQKRMGVLQRIPTMFVPFGEGC
jgi:hypothetical protein